MRPAAFLVVLGAMLALGGTASADTDCNIIEISASNAKEPSIDADLKPLEKKLKKPPFSAYNTFKQLSRFDRKLVTLKAESLALKRGSASVLLRSQSEKRADLTITMDSADGKRVLDVKQVANLGDWTMVVAAAKDEGHILALTCK